MDDAQANAKSKTLPLLRSPSSPPPQFPAIGANELNEMHQNYTVVRSGDIIEKNGTYYSTDGTIRGYSGTVKKLANSTTLNEVFVKQRELEQQHEKDYELELMQKAEVEQQQQLQSKSELNRTTPKNAKNNFANVQKSSQQTNAARHTQNLSVASPPQASNLNAVNASVKATRMSLGNIISNEKKSTSNLATSTLSSEYF